MSTVSNLRFFLIPALRTKRQDEYTNKPYSSSVRKTTEHSFYRGQRLLGLPNKKKRDPPPPKRSRLLRAANVQNDCSKTNVPNNVPDINATKVTGHYTKMLQHFPERNRALRPNRPSEKIARNI